MLRRSARCLCLGTPDFMSKIQRFPRPLRCKEYGDDILQDPLWNKALAFDHAERERLGIRGLLPPAVRTLEDQVERTLANCRMQPTPQLKNLYLQGLHCRNETLFHRVLLDHIEELAPLVYTPTVGRVCQEFGSHFRRPRGMYFTAADRGHFSTMVQNWPHDDVHVIVVTDGSRILGLGDLGCNGMGISIGKLALYCACGGIAPHRVLPVMLDVGTNNEAFRKAPGYVGLRQPRLEGEEYYALVDEFMSAVTGRWHDVCVQFEDFQTERAVPLLKKYRNTFRCFNDDIQGTGAVTVAGLIAATHQAGVDLKDLRVVVCGGGSAGQGVAASIYDAIQRSGVADCEADKRIVIVDHLGAVGAETKDGPHAGVDESLGRWRNNGFQDGAKLLDVINEHKPHVILGLTAFKGAFGEEHIRAMSSHVPRPIVMPLSNPTDKAECSAEEAYRWSDGRAIVSTGSPFEPVTLPDGSVRTPSQCNNMYVFPGLGLAASVAGVTKFTDSMFFAASKAIADTVNEEEKAIGRTFPHVTRIRDVSKNVAVAVIEDALRQTLTKKIKKHHIREGIDAVVARKMYFPDYVPLYSTRPSSE